MSGVTSGRSASAERAQEDWWHFDAGDHVVGLGWSPDGARLAALTGAGALFILDARTGQPIPRSPAAHSGGALARDGAAGGLATGGQDGKIKLWDADGGTVLATFDGAAGNRRTWVEQVRWSPDGALLATAAGKSLRVWNPASGGQFIEYADHPSTVAALCWRPDGKAICAGFYGGASFYRLEETKPYQRIAWKGSILSLAWSPNARYVAAGTQEATVNFWKLPYRPGEELNMSGYANKVRELAWNPTSRFLATGGSEVVIVWDVSGKGPAGTVPKQLRAHTRKVTLLAWQQGGGRLVSGDADGNVAVWEPGKTSSPLCESKLADAVSAGAWSPDEHAVAIGSASGGVVVWDVSAGK